MLNRVSKSGECGDTCYRQILLSLHKVVVVKCKTAKKSIYSIFAQFFPLHFFSCISVPTKQVPLRNPFFYCEYLGFFGWRKLPMAIWIRRKILHLILQKVYEWLPKIDKNTNFCPISMFRGGCRQIQEIQSIQIIGTAFHYGSIQTISLFFCLLSK